jgi:hypothetical protein
MGKKGCAVDPWRRLSTVGSGSEICVKEQTLLPEDHCRGRALRLWVIDCTVPRTSSLLCVFCCQVGLTLSSLRPCPKDSSIFLASSLQEWGKHWYQQAKCHVSSVLPQWRTQCSLCFTLSPTHAGDTPRIEHLMSLGAQTGDLWSKWEPAQAKKFTEARSNSQNTKEGKQRNISQVIVKTPAHRLLHSVYYSTIHNSQAMETAQMPYNL